MSSKIVKRRIEDLVDVYNYLRVPLSSKQRELLAKIYPYYGAQNIVDFVDSYIFDGEYILVAEDGENLKSNNQNICNLVNGKFWVNNHAHILKANNQNITKYLYYNFNRIKFEPYITGSAQPKLNKENLLNIFTFVHEKDEQQKIASVLSTFDSKIELNNRINAELESMAKTIYDYWFVQFDFPISAEQAKAMGKPELEGKPYKSSGGKMVWNEELKRDVPEGWEVKRLDKLGDIVGGSTPSREIAENFTEEGIAWITPKDLSINQGKKFIKKGELDVSNVGLKSASLNVMPRGTILMSSRAPVGYLAIARNDVTTNQGFKSFVPNKGISSEYLYYAIKNLLPVIENNSSGSTFKEISTSTLKTILNLLPNLDVIEKYTFLVKPIFNKQELIEEENHQLAKLRDWLLPMLMNGQVKVK